MAYPDPWLETQICIQLPHGLHLRPASSIVKLARSFDAEILLALGHRTASAKNLSSLLQLEASCGSFLLLRARGPDAPSALLAISKQLQPSDSS